MTSSSQPLARLGPSVAKLVLCLGAIYAMALWVSWGGIGAAHPRVMAAAVLVDLTVTAGAVYGWTIVRPGHARPRSVIALMVINLLIARWLIDWGDAGALLTALAAVGALAELTLVGLTLARLRQVVSAFRLARHDGAPRRVALEAGLAAAMPPAIARAAVVELSIVTYALIGWLWPVAKADGQRIFTYHRRSYWTALAIVFAFMIVVESTALHFLLSGLSTTLAGIHAVLMLYSLVWLIGDLQLMRRSPITLSEGALSIQMGARWAASIPVQNVSSVAAVTSPPEGEGLLDIGLPGSPRVSIDLKEEATLQGLFGMTRQVRCLCIGVDEPEGFVMALTQASREGDA